MERVYTWAAQPQNGFTNFGLKIISNIIWNGLGAPLGSGVGGIPPAFGIYTDDGSNGVIIDSNTIFNNIGAGINIHHASNITMRHNKIFNNRSGLMVYNSPVLNMTFTNNYLSTNIYQYNTYPFNLIIGYTNNLAAMGKSDSNFYYRTSFDSTLFGYNSSQYSLYGWKVASGNDLYSFGRPLNVTSDTPIIKYNVNSIAYSFALNGTYYDFRGRAYNSSVILQPFQSVILFKGITNIIDPDVFIPYKFNRKMKFKKLRLR